MKKVLVVLVLVLFIQSCEDKSHLLTKSPWGLYHRFAYDFDNPQNIIQNTYFKKSGKQLILQFNIDRTVNINENNGDKHTTTKWAWSSTEKESMIIHDFGDSGKYTVSQLDSKKLTLTKTYLKSGTVEILYLKHFDDNEWEDAIVEKLNQSIK